MVMASQQAVEHFLTVSLKYLLFKLITDLMAIITLIVVGAWMFDLY